MSVTGCPLFSLKGWPKKAQGIVGFATGKSSRNSFWIVRRCKPIRILTPTAYRRRSFHRRYFDLPFAAKHLDADIVIVPQEEQIDRRLADAEVTNLELFEKRRQGWVRETETAF